MTTCVDVLAACPRSHSCGAAVCPLMPPEQRGVHLPGERVCFYALESGKPGAAEYHADDPTFAAVLAGLPEVTMRYPAIGMAIEKAATMPSRGTNLRQKAVNNAENGVSTPA